MANDSAGVTEDPGTERRNSPRLLLYTLGDDITYNNTVDNSVRMYCSTPGRKGSPECRAQEPLHSGQS